MKLTNLQIDGLKIIEPRVIGDTRGWFMESFKADWFKQNVANVDFVQDNQSFSSQTNTIRGLHYQKAPSGQGKLVRVLRGKIFDVAVDIRANSPSFGEWLGIELSAENQKQLWIPEGFLHGFCTLVPDCEIFYKVTAPYDPVNDAGIAFDDCDIAIEWPLDIVNAVVSDKDRNQPSLKSLR